MIRPAGTLLIGLLSLFAAACSTGDGTSLAPPNPTAPPTTSAPPVDPSAAVIGNGEAPLTLPEIDDVVPAVAEVAIVGDSLSVAAEDEIMAELDARGVGVVAFDAVEGRRISAGTDTIEGGVAVAQQVRDRLAISGPPDLWVVALGTNDVGREADVEVFERHAAELLSMLDGERVVWVDVYIEGRPEGTASVNRVLANLAAASDQISVANWSTVAPIDGMLAGDGVHLTDRGEGAFANLIADAVVVASP